MKQNAEISATHDYYEFVFFDRMRRSTTKYDELRSTWRNRVRSVGPLAVEKVFHAIEVVEALGINPADAAPEHWHHVHNRLSVNETPRPYTHTQHQAWLRRQRIAL